MPPKRWLTAAEAAAALGISRSTLYAYVSRGLLRAAPVEGDGRVRRYRADEITQLQERRAARREPRQAAAQALDWGMPVVESALTQITEQGHYYRGVSALDLAEGATLEEVAALLWGDPTEDAAPPPERALGPIVEPCGALGASAVARMQLALILAGQAGAYPPSAASAAALLRLLAAAALGAPPAALPVAEALQRAWCPDAPAARPLLDAAMILCADHELNISSFTARCVASAGSALPDALLAGLSALKGYRHGGATQAVARFFDAALAAPDPVAFLDRALAGRGHLAGFHHRLYPSGDPRARHLIALARAYPTPAAALEPLLTLIAQVEARLDERATVDVGLVLLARALGLPPDAPLLLFALGRAVGWAAHAIEQSEHTLLRPRARYIGPRPPRRAAPLSPRPKTLEWG